MKIKDGEVISEIWPEGTPANYGNSMAETGRYAHLLFFANESPLAEIKLLNFITKYSYVESANPLCPSDWEVSSDQCLPWFLAIKCCSLWAPTEMRYRIKDSQWKTPDGNYVSPMFYAILTRNNFLLNLFVGLQALIFKLPWRWNDQQKKFESSVGSSADYLNWFHCALYCKSWVRYLVPKSTLLDKINSYYAIEPNAKWLLDLYKKVIDENY